LNESSPLPVPRFPVPARPDRQPGDPWTISTLVQELIHQSYDDDWWETYLHHRVVELEHALVSRRARRALRRQIRDSADTFAWAGPTFRDRRMEAVFNTFMCDMAEREQRSAA
jgi:hypothetical protein